MLIGASRISCTRESLESCGAKRRAMLAEWHSYIDPSTSMLIVQEGQQIDGEPFHSPYPRFECILYVRAKLLKLSLHAFQAATERASLLDLLLRIFFCGLETWTAARLKTIGKAIHAGLFSLPSHLLVNPDGAVQTDYLVSAIVWLHVTDTVSVKATQQSLRFWLHGRLMNSRLISLSCCSCRFTCFPIATPLVRKLDFNSCDILRKTSSVTVSCHQAGSLSDRRLP